MPFKEDMRMSPKKEFVILASQEQANVRELCRRFRVSRLTGYKKKWDSYLLILIYVSSNLSPVLG